jgi:uroporphyrinogen decarboxylase
MRQAGRHLPEYRALRARVGSFLDLCYDPGLASEATLQPILRYGFDAAILFSDILVVPDALGQTVRFIEGEGPRLDALRSGRALARLDRSAVLPKFQRVWETVARVRAQLPTATALIGFCGAPFTVATYMVAGQASPDQAEARRWAYAHEGEFEQLIDLLVDVSSEYLAGQAAQGADAVQIFDSWAGSLPDAAFERWVIAPTRRLTAALRARHPKLPIIGFPRGAGALARRYVACCGVDGIGCDTTMPLDVMARELAPRAVVQGNLDPLLLRVGGAELARRVAAILKAMAGARFVFNLGHGVDPETPPQHVVELLEQVRRGG